MKKNYKLKKILLYPGDVCGPVEDVFKYIRTTVKEQRLENAALSFEYDYDGGELSIIGEVALTSEEIAARVAKSERGRAAAAAKAAKNRAKNLKEFQNLAKKLDIPVEIPNA